MTKRPKEHDPARAAPAAPEPWDRLPAWSWPVLVLLAGALPFLPAVTAGFFALDDARRLADNSAFRGLGLAQLRWVFLSFHPGGAYEPVTWLSHTADFLLWGLKPAGIHAASLALHALNGVLLYLLLLRLLGLQRSEGSSRGWVHLCAAAGAALFAVHPLRVEVVAWASQRGCLLAALFALVSTLAYLEAYAPLPEDAVGRTGWLSVSAAACALSLLSKPLALGLPLVLLLLDVWPLRRRESAAPGGPKGPSDVAPGTAGSGAAPAGWGALFREKWPWLAIVLAVLVVGANAAYVSGAVVPWSAYGLLARLGQQAFAVCFGLEKTLLPAGLAPLYEAENVTASLVPQLHPLDALCSLRALVLLGTTVWALWTLRRRPKHPESAGLGRPEPTDLGCSGRPVAAGLWLAYLALALPSAGEPKQEVLQQVAGDRWTYLPALCLAAAAALAAARLEHLRRWLSHGLALLLLLLAGASLRRAALWADPVRFWKEAADAAPSCRTCALTCARLLEEAGRHEEAVQVGESSLRQSSGLAAFPGLIRAAQNAGSPERAGKYGALARGSDPAAAKAMANQLFIEGFQLSQQGRNDEALERTLAAASLDPSHPGVQYNLGFFYQTKGKLAEAEKHYREAVRLNPSAGNAHHNLGVVLAGQGKVSEAVPECMEAARMDPVFAAPDCPRK